MPLVDPREGVFRDGVVSPAILHERRSGWRRVFRRLPGFVNQADFGEQIRCLHDVRVPLVRWRVTERKFCIKSINLGLSSFYNITARRRSCWMVMFSWVILSTGGAAVLPGTMHPLWDHTPPGSYPPETMPLFLLQYSPPANEVAGRQCFHRRSYTYPLPRDHKSGWYASYWNAFLFSVVCSFNFRTVPVKEGYLMMKQFVYL